ncbi:MAG: CoA-transferase, partial [Woeseia sp.]
DGREFVLEPALKADFALIKCRRADRFGNLVYSKTARNFSPVMATAATTTIVQTNETVEIGELDPESIVTPAIYVDRIVEIKSPLQESELVARQVRYP